MAATNPARPSSRAVRARPKRDAEVVEAATRIFYERGYADASVQDVADALGILKGSLYHYIKTKEDLLFRVLEDVHFDVQQILEEVAAIEGLDPLDRLGLYIRRQVLYNLDNLERISVYYHDIGRLGPERRADIVARRRGHDAFVTELIREAQARGEADPALDPRLASNCVFATIIWTYRWYRTTGPTARPQIADVCASFAVNGVRR
jgi:AcrR family transcriptional regulator